MRYVVAISPIDYFGGCIEPRERSRDFFHTGEGDRPVIVKYRKDTRHNFFTLMGHRTVSYSAAETAWHEHFAAVQAVIKSRREDETQLNQDIAAFKAQKQYKTFRAYMWHTAEQVLSSHNEGGGPSNQ